MTQAQHMTPADIAALLRRNHELECESKVRRKEAELLRGELAKRDDNVVALTGKLASADAETEQLRAQLAWFKKQVFGAKSERRILEALSPADQLWLGEQMLELSENPPADNETGTDVEDKGRRGKGKRPAKPARCEDSLSSRLHFDESVPVEEVIVKDPELEALPQNQVEIDRSHGGYRPQRFSAVPGAPQARAPSKNQTEQPVFPL